MNQCWNCWTAFYEMPIPNIIGVFFFAPHSMCNRSDHIKPSQRPTCQGVMRQCQNCPNLQRLLSAAFFTLDEKNRRKKHQKQCCWRLHDSYKWVLPPSKLQVSQVSDRSKADSVGDAPGKTHIPMNPTHINTCSCHWHQLIVFWCILIGCECPYMSWFCFSLLHPRPTNRVLAWYSLNPCWKFPYKMIELESWVPQKHTKTIKNLRTSKFIFWGALRLRFWRVARRECQGTARRNKSKKHKNVPRTFSVGPRPFFHIFRGHARRPPFWIILKC